MYFFYALEIPADPFSAKPRLIILRQKAGVP
jgi:hypothetical protein